MAFLEQQSGSKASFWAVVALLGLLNGCAASRVSLEPTLDPLTGVTFGRSAKPVVFYRDNSGQAAYARDYVYLGPIWVNRVGDYQYYLWLGLWSTHGGSIDDTQRRDEFARVTIIADGEPLSLEVAGWTPSDIGTSTDVYAKPVASAVDAYYPVTLDQIRFLSEASDIRIDAVAGGNDSYTLWDGANNGGRSLRRFVQRVMFPE